MFYLKNNKIMKLYVRTPLSGSEFKVCNEITDEVIAIFYNQNDAIEYCEFKNKR